MNNKKVTKRKETQENNKNGKMKIKRKPTLQELGSQVDHQVRYILYRVHKKIYSNVRNIRPALVGFEHF